MERRDVLLGVGALAAAVWSQGARAEDAPMQHAHEHMHGGAHNSALVAAASDCVRAGEICIDHCLHLFAEGNTTTAACARNVTLLVPVCQALMQLAAANSKHLPAFARVAMNLCKDCEDECRKHEKEHEACKNCADACAACARECEKVAA